MVGVSISTRILNLPAKEYMVMETVRHVELTSGGKHASGDINQVLVLSATAIPSAQPDQVTWQ